MQSSATFDGSFVYQFCVFSVMPKSGPSKAFTISLATVVVLVPTVFFMPVTLVTVVKLATKALSVESLMMPKYP